MTEGAKREAGELLRAAMQTPLALALEIVASLRRAQKTRLEPKWKSDPEALRPFTGKEASIACLFAAARMMRLSGTSEDGFAEAARAMWKLSAEDEEVSAYATRRSKPSA